MGDYDVDPYGNGYMISYYGRHKPPGMTTGYIGAAYCGIDCIWQSGPIISEPFDSEAQADLFASQMGLEPRVLP